MDKNFLPDLLPPFLCAMDAGRVAVTSTVWKKIQWQRDRIVASFKKSYVSLDIYIAYDLDFVEYALKSHLSILFDRVCPLTGIERGVHSICGG